MSGLKRFLFVEGGFSLTKLGMLIAAIAAGALTIGLPESWLVWVKLAGIIGAAIAGIGARDAVDKIAQK